MDRVVGQRAAPVAEDEATSDLDESQDIEDELYRSSREAGITAAGFVPALEA